MPKAKPLKRNPRLDTNPSDQPYSACPPEEATHLKLKMPGPYPDRILPVIIKGDRKETPCWTWNGDTEKPTLKPSILTRMEWGDGWGGTEICHSFVTDGKVQFLDDCTHELAGQTVDLPEVD